MSEQTSKHIPTTATVNGVPYVIGGWAGYELSRRHALDEHPYAGRSYVTNRELIDDLLSSTKKYTLKPVITAGRKLARKLESIENTDLSKDAKEVQQLIDITSEDVDEFCHFLREEDWTHYMKYVNKFINNLNQIKGGKSDVPKVNNLDIKYIDIKDYETIEKESLDYISQLEQLLKWMAEKMDSLADDI